MQTNSFSLARPALSLGLLVFAVGLTGCPKDAAPPPAPVEASAAKTAEPIPSSPPSAPAASTNDGMVTVAAAGTKFDPAVNKSQIPDGAYICDMGTVHYASLDEGDGKCPRCHMALKKHSARAETQ